MKMLTVFVSLFLLGAGSLFLPGAASSHDIDFNIGINMGEPPPRVVVTRPAALYAIPGTPAYYAPDLSRQIYFYSNNWYRLYNGYWYRASFSDGPWMFLQPERVPVVFIDLSPEYYVIPPREQYRPYWKQKVYWREREHRRYEERREWDGRSHRNRGRDHDGWKDYREDKRPRRGHGRT